MEAWLKFGRAAVIFTTVMISNSKILNINFRKPIKSLEDKDQVENPEYGRVLKLRLIGRMTQEISAKNDLI